MKKILVIGPSYQNQPRSVANALRRRGYDVQLYLMTDFYMGCTYWQKKQYKLGFRSVKQRYEARTAEELRMVCEGFRPNCVLVLNGLMINPLALEAIASYDKILWMWDALHRAPRLETILPYFRRVFTFEQQDAATLQQVRGLDATCLPLGYDETIFYPRETKKDIDLSFIGIPTPRRLRILNRIAQYAERENKTLLVGGPWYATEHFWKKYVFQRKHPALMKCIQNRIFTPEEVADIYRHSRICLNIIVEGHNGYNPRVFEIAATEARQVLVGSHEGMMEEIPTITCTDESHILEAVKSAFGLFGKQVEHSRWRIEYAIENQVKHIMEIWENGGE